MSIGRSGVFRAVFILACVLAWLCAIAAGLELGARMFAAKTANPPATFYCSLTQARQKFTSVYERYLKPWPAPMPTYPLVEVYSVQDDAQRQATAEVRGEWAVLIDNQCRIVRTYGIPLENRGQWTSRAAPGCPLTALVEQTEPPQSEEEMKGRLKNLFQTGFASNMPMNLPAEGTAGVMRVDVGFVPVWYDMVVRQAVVTFRPSVWMPGGKTHFVPHATMRGQSELVMMEQFSTNSLGYRSPEITLPKPAGMLRIVCVGGSTTVEGYDNRMTYPAILQEMLREKFPQVADRIEVVNCGVIGLVSSVEIGMQPEILAIEPDIVLYYNGINDLSRCYRDWVNTDDAWPATGDRLRHHIGRSAFLRRFWHDKLIPSDAAFTKFVRMSAMDNLERLYAGYQAHGVTVAACSFAGPEPDVISGDDCLYADMQTVPGWFYDMDLRTYTRLRGLFNATLKELCGRINALYLPVAEEQRAGFDQFTDLCHMTPKGIENKARIVCTHIMPLVAERLGLK